MQNQKGMNFQRTDKLIMAISIFMLSFGYFILGQGHAALAAVTLLLGFILPVIGLLGFEATRSKISNLFKKEYFGRKSLEIVSFSFCVLSSTVVYFMTAAPSSSLWDCSEFIAAAYKLQVPHPPGAPLFLILGKVFSLFAFGETTQVAFAINAVSVISSGLAVGFAFGIAYLVLKKTVCRAFAVIGAITSAMTMAFIDTFWFSAVEAEVYAMAACYCFLLVFVALYLKEKGLHDQPRPLVLLAYLFGLGYCIHPMCLLIIPVVTCIYLPYIQRYGFRGWMISFALGGILLLICNRVVTEGLFQLAYQLDVWLVNTFSLPFYSSVIVLLLLTGLIWVMITRYAKQLQNAFWMVVIFVFGLSPNMVLFVGSSNDPAMDQHNPENLQTIASYMTRESYGTRPLLYGPYYDSEITDVKTDGQKYLKTDEGYMPNGPKLKYVYDKTRKTIFPRMYSSDAKHIRVYEEWANLRKGEQPLFKHNLRYLFQYQLGHMFFRYFGWNFISRKGDYMHDGWLEPWAKQSNLAGDFHDNKAQNQYWLIPFLLGMIGVWYNVKLNKEAFWCLLSLFLITGPILAFYLNSPPVEPRERDYIYVVSFMTFCIWIGFGVAAIGNLLLQKLRNERTPLIVMVCISIGLSGLLLTVNYDDHNRSHQTIHLEHGRVVLESCQPNAILFTGGDNDTFPLWYLQQVEGLRTDVRVVVLSYFNSDWCLQQSKDWQADSPPLPIVLSDEQLRSDGPNDVVFLNKKATIDVRKLVQLINLGHKGLRMPGNFGTYYHQVPGNKFSIKGDLKPERYSADVQRYLKEKIAVAAKSSRLYKSDLAFLDIAAHNNWDRPIYFNATSLNGLNVDIDTHVIKEGLLYRFLPIDTNEQIMNPKKNYELLVEKAVYTPLENNHYLTSENHVLRIIEPLKASYNQLAYELMRSNEPEKAKQTILYALDRFYPHHLSPGMHAVHLAKLMFEVGMNSKATELLERTILVSKELKRQGLQEGLVPYHDYVLQQAYLLVEELGKD